MFRIIASQERYESPRTTVEVSLFRCGFFSLYHINNCLLFVGNEFLPTILVPTILVPTILVPTILVPTILVPTILVPTTLVPTILVPTILVQTIFVSNTFGFSLQFFLLFVLISSKFLDFTSIRYMYLCCSHLKTNVFKSDCNRTFFCTKLIVQYISLSFIRLGGPGINYQDSYLQMFLRVLISSFV